MRERTKNQLDCLTCGACCLPVREQSAFCDLTSEDMKGFSPQFITANVEFPRALEQFIYGFPIAALRTKWRTMKSGPLKGIDLCVCCMLDGSILQRVRCRIYSTRPNTCKRTVVPGDQTCIKVRRLWAHATKMIGG